MDSKKVKDLRRSVKQSRSGSAAPRYIMSAFEVLRRNDFGAKLVAQAQGLQYKGEDITFRELADAYLNKKDGKGKTVRTRLGRMWLLPYSAIQAGYPRWLFGSGMKSIPDNSEIKTRKGGHLVEVGSIPDDSRVVFVSHKWRYTGSATPKRAEYDDENFALGFMNALRAYAEKKVAENEWERSKIYFWADYWGVAQTAKNNMTWVAAIHLYVMLSTDLLVVFENEGQMRNYGDDKGWYMSKWCRLEFAVHYMVNTTRVSFIAHTKDDDIHERKDETRKVLDPTAANIYIALLQTRPT